MIDGNQNKDTISDNQEISPERGPSMAIQMGMLEKDHEARHDGESTDIDLASASDKQYSQSDILPQHNVLNIHESPIQELQNDTSYTEDPESQNFMSERKRRIDMIDLDDEKTPEMLKHNSLSMCQKLLMMRRNDGSDKRHYGRNLPQVYVGTRPFIVIGPDWPFCLVTWSVMLWFYFGSCSDMYIHYKYYWETYAFFFVQRTVHFISCFSATLTNPGFACNVSLQKWNEEFKVGAKSADELLEIGREKGWKECYPCNIYMGPGTSHCRRCDVCLYELDHHCPWMGKCVAKDNLLAFYTFLFFTFLSLFYALFLNTFML